MAILLKKKMENNLAKRKIQSKNLVKAFFLQFKKKKKTFEKKLVKKMLVRKKVVSKNVARKKIDPKFVW